MMNTQRRTIPRSVAIFSENIKLEHTIFALPFAYLGTLLAAGGLPEWETLLWVTLAMAGARTAAMSFNRYIDRHIDARNPRTSRRPIPAGQLSPRIVLLAGIVSIGVLLLSAAMLNPLCLALSPIAVVALVGYSYTKRWTPLCHVALGFTDALAPAGGWLAVRPSFAWPEVAPMLLLSLAVGLWIGGFDMLYACQDVDFDRREGLHSIPADWGVPAGLLAARVCHILMIVALAGAGLLLGLAWPFYVALAATVGLLIWEHRLVRPDDLSRINLAFFNINGYIAVVLFAGTLAAVLLN
jgi:4-hydroxybenzoate polyprenyltransferase